MAGDGMKAVGERIRSLRAARGWSQAELASKVGRSQATVSYLENGAANPSYALLTRLAEAFGCSMGDLIEAPAAPPEAAA